MGFNPKEVFRAIEKTTDSVPQLASKVDKFGAIELTEEEKSIFADTASQLRFKDENFLNEVWQKNYAATLLRTRRYDDNGNSLWKVFNRVQENLLRGGSLRVKGFDNRGRLKKSKTKVIKSVSQNIRLNQSLWSLTEQMAELKQGMK